MESNWRYGVEALGWGGTLRGTVVTGTDHLVYMAQLNPPVITGGGTATWIAVGSTDVTGFRWWIFGKEDPVGWFVPLVTLYRNANLHFPSAAWPVLPDH